MGEPGYEQGRWECECGFVAGVSFIPAKTKMVTLTCYRCEKTASIRAADLIAAQLRKEAARLAARKGEGR